MSKFKKGEHVIHKKQNISGIVKKDENGIVTLTNEESSSSHYFVKKDRSEFYIINTLSIIGIITSIILFLVKGS